MSWGSEERKDKLESDFYFIFFILSYLFNHCLFSAHWHQSWYVHPRNRGANTQRSASSHEIFVSVQTITRLKHRSYIALFITGMVLSNRLFNLEKWQAKEICTTSISEKGKQVYSQETPHNYSKERDQVESTLMIKRRVVPMLIILCWRHISLTAEQHSN